MGYTINKTEINSDPQIGAELAELNRRLLKLAPAPGTSGSSAANDSMSEYAARQLRGQGTLAHGDHDVPKCPFNLHALRQRATLNRYFNDMPKRNALLSRMKRLKEKLGKSFNHAPAPQMAVTI